MVDPNDLNRKHIYIQVKKGDVDLNTDDYSSLNGEVYLLTTEGNVQNAQKYTNVKVADPTVIYEFAINPDKSHIIPENVLYWVKFLTEIADGDLFLNGLACFWVNMPPYRFPHCIGPSSLSGHFLDASISVG